MMTQPPLTILEFNGTTIRACRSVSAKRERAITHCFFFEAGHLDNNTYKMIRRQLRIHALKPGNVILSLPRYQAMSRLLRLPSSDPQEISHMVALHISYQAVFNKDKDILYDYEIVGFDSEGQALVSVFSILKSRLKKYLDILEKLSISPVCVTLNTQGLLDWSLLQDVRLKNDDPRGIYLLNIDHGTYDFNVVFDRHVVFSRTFVRTGDDPLEAAQGLAKEVKVSIELFKRRGEKRFMCEDNIYWVGSLNDFKGIEVREFFNQPLIFLSPLENINVPPSLKETIAGSPVSFVSVLGLALRGERKGIDMTPAELKTLLQEKKMAGIWRKALIAIISMSLLWTLWGIGKIDKKIHILKNTLPRLIALGSLAKEAAVAQQFDKIEKEVLGGFLFTDYLYELYHLTPASIFLINLSMGAENVLSMTGAAQDSASVFSYLKALEHSAIFKNVRLDYIDEKDPTAGKIRFKITCPRRFYDGNRQSQKPLF